MNLLQGILGAVSAMQGGQQQASAGNPMLNAVLGMLAGGGQQGANAGAGAGGALGGLGGLGGLVSMFENAGLGNLIQSWISTGQNMPINGEQLQQVLGQGRMGDLAQQLGMSKQDAAGQLSQALPQIIDMLTPHGQAPQGGFGDIGSIVGMLQKSLTR